MSPQLLDVLAPFQQISATLAMWRETTCRGGVMTDLRDNKPIKGKSKSCQGSKVECNHALLNCTINVGALAPQALYVHKRSLQITSISCLALLRFCVPALLEEQRLTEDTWQPTYSGEEDLTLSSLHLVAIRYHPAELPHLFSPSLSLRVRRWPFACARDCATSAF